MHLPLATVPVVRVHSIWCQTRQSSAGCRFAQQLGSPSASGAGCRCAQHLVLGLSKQGCGFRVWDPGRTSQRDAG